MKKLCFILFTLFAMTMCNTAKTGQRLLIETSYGDIKVVLYDETPLHRDNFIKLAQEGYYDNLTFHRVIKEFMIQGGDVKAGKDSDDDKFDDENLIAPEFRTPQYFHKAGSLAAARWGNDENPGKKSDPHQFYIVSGKTLYNHDIVTMEKERFEKLLQSIYREKQSASMDTIKAMYREGNKGAITEYRAGILAEAEKEAETRRGETLFTDEQKEAYTTLGGTPHLDGEYTIFGEVYEGLDVVKQIEKVETNASDKPVQPVIIKKVSLIK